MRVRKIQLCFENCEVCNLEPDEFKYLIIDGIRSMRRINCFQCRAGETMSMKECEYFAITINKKALDLKQANWNDIPLKERLQQCDIVSVILFYDNRKKEEIYVPWGDKSEWENEYQKNTVLDDGEMEIRIEEPKCYLKS